MYDDTETIFDLQMLEAAHEAWLEREAELADAECVETEFDEIDDDDDEIEEEFEDDGESRDWANGWGSDGDVDGDALASAGFGTDEDYGYFGGGDDW